MGLFLNGLGSFNASISESPSRLFEAQNERRVLRALNSVRDQIEISEKAIEEYEQARDLPRGLDSLQRPDFVKDQISEILNPLKPKVEDPTELEDDVQEILETLDEAEEALRLAAKVARADDAELLDVRREIGRLKTEALTPSVEVDLTEAPRSVQVLSTLQELGRVEDELDREEEL